MKRRAASGWRSSGLKSRKCWTVGIKWRACLNGRERITSKCVERTSESICSSTIRRRMSGFCAGVGDFRGTLSCFWILHARFRTTRSPGFVAIGAKVYVAKIKRAKLAAIVAHRIFIKAKRLVHTNKIPSLSPRCMAEDKLFLRSPEACRDITDQTSPPSTSGNDWCSTVSAVNARLILLETSCGCTTMVAVVRKLCFK